MVLENLLSLMLYRKTYLLTWSIESLMPPKIMYTPSLIFMPPCNACSFRPRGIAWQSAQGTERLSYKRKGSSLVPKMQTISLEQPEIDRDQGLGPDESESTCETCEWVRDSNVSWLPNFSLMPISITTECSYLSVLDCMLQIQMFTASLPPKMQKYLSFGWQTPLCRSLFSFILGSALIVSYSKLRVHTKFLGPESQLPPKIVIQLGLVGKETVLQIPKGSSTAVIVHPESGSLTFKYSRTVDLQNSAVYPPTTHSFPWCTRDKNVHLDLLSGGISVHFIKLSFSRVTPDL